MRYINPRFTYFTYYDDDGNKADFLQLQQAVSMSSVIESRELRQIE